MNDFKKALGEIVRKARKEKGLTQSQLADLIQADTRTILNIENNKGNPKLEILFPLIRTLEINPYCVFYPEELVNSSAYDELRTVLHDCTEEDLKKALPIIRAAISVIVSPRSMKAE